MILLRGALVAIGVILVLASILPFVRTNEWWVRIWDFPRIQIAVLVALVLTALPFVLPWRRVGTWLLAMALLAAGVTQLVLIWPYTPWHPSNVDRHGSCDAGSSLRLLIANVLMTNRDAEPLLEQVRTLQPDLVLLVETDDWWDTRLAPLKARFPHVVSRPRDNFYGLHFFSRLELIDPKVRFLIDEYVPSLRTGVRLPSGAVFEFHGVHTKPPPHQDTARRDAELLLAAREMRESQAPSILAGDLNDVAWSRSARLFRDVGGLLDPRIGRGPYPTFNANWPLLRWPLDHVYFQAPFAFQDLRVLGAIGSDHFPVFASLCHAPETAHLRSPPPPDSEDLEDAREAIAAGHAVARAEP